MPSLAMTLTTLWNNSINNNFFLKYCRKENKFMNIFMAKNHLLTRNLDCRYPFISHCRGLIQSPWSIILAHMIAILPHPYLYSWVIWHKKTDHQSTPWPLLPPRIWTIIPHHNPVTYSIDWTEYTGLQPSQYCLSQSTTIYCYQHIA